MGGGAASPRRRRARGGRGRRRRGGVGAAAARRGEAGRRAPRRHAGQPGQYDALPPPSLPLPKGTAAVLTAEAALHLGRPRRSPRQRPHPRLCRCRKVSQVVAGHHPSRSACSGGAQWHAIPGSPRMAPRRIAPDGACRLQRSRHRWRPSTPTWTPAQRRCARRRAACRPARPPTRSTRSSAPTSTRSATATTPRWAIRARQGEKGGSRPSSPVGEHASY